MIAVIPSRFNVQVAVTSDGQYNHLIYNTLTGSITKVNQALAQVLKTKDPNDINLLYHSSLVDILTEQGIFVPKDFDEIGVYDAMHRRWKEGKENVEINVLLTYDCNFECPYCYQGRGSKGDLLHGFRYMDDALVAAIERFAKDTVTDRGARKLEIVLYGGEPFLPGAKEKGKMLVDNCANWAAGNGVEFCLHALSNGSLISEEDVKWLSGYPTRLQIPVDGAPNTHNRYRFFKDTANGSFNRIAQTLEWTRKYSLETHIRVSLTEDTYPTMEQMLRELKRLGLDHVYVDFCYITAFTDACQTFKDHTLPDNRLFKLMPELWLQAHKMGFPLDIRPQIQPLPCSSIADGSFIIDPFANVYKCWEHVGLKEHIVGKLQMDGSLERTQVYGEILERNPLTITPCRSHAYLPACGGGCVCKAYWQHQTYHASGCGTERFLLRDKIRCYVATLGKSSEIKEESIGLFTASIVEGRQTPLMRHCYVLV